MIAERDNLFFSFSIYICLHVHRAHQQLYSNYTLFCKTKYDKQRMPCSRQLAQP